jgi:hypothetical protein
MSWSFSIPATANRDEAVAAFKARAGADVPAWLVGGLSAAAEALMQDAPPGMNVSFSSNGHINGAAQQPVGQGSASVSISLLVPAVAHAPAD